MIRRNFVKGLAGAGAFLGLAGASRAARTPSEEQLRKDLHREGWSGPVGFRIDLTSRMHGGFILQPRVGRKFKVVALSVGARDIEDPSLIWPVDIRCGTCGSMKVPDAPDSPPFQSTTIDATTIPPTALFNIDDMEWSFQTMAMPIPKLTLTLPREFILTPGKAFWLSVWSPRDIEIDGHVVVKEIMPANFEW